MPNKCAVWFLLPLLTALLLIYATVGAMAQTDDFIFSERFSGIQNISSYLEVWQDSSRNQSIEDILSNPRVEFSSVEDARFTTQFPAVIWQRIELTNDGRFDIPAAFTFCHRADSIELYTVENNESVYTAQTGSAFTPSGKSIPSVNNSLQIYLPAETSRTYYVRQTFLHPIAPSHFSELYIKDPPELIAELMFKYTGQAFYAGLMLMFALLSFFGWLLLHDRSFLYFSLVHLAFALYFLAVKNVFGVFVINVPDFWVFNLEDVSISLLITSLFVFIAHYLRLREQRPRAYRTMLIVTIFVVLNKYIHNLFSDDRMMTGMVNNAFILVWLVAIVITIVRSARKGISEARNLLVSLFILVITAAVYLFAITGFIPQNSLTMHSIQIGSVLFALLVFYRLFEAVRSIENEQQRVLTISELKTKFFTNVSHEFRTPLTLILSPLEKLGESVKTSDQKKLIHLATKHANRLLHMINQLLDIARLEEGEVQLSVQEINVVPYTKGILMSFESLAENKEITLNFERSHPEIPLWLDTEKMEVILYNLLSNALKHTPAGGEVAVKVTEHSEKVQIQVKDTGVGIPAELLPHVFDRFFRIENTGAEGSGIGLCLANELTELHEGHISVKSKVGVGSVFTLEFKKGNAHFETAQLAKNVQEVKNENGSALVDSTQLDEDLLTQMADSAVFPSTANGTRPSVLLVEDNADVRAFIRSQLIDRFEVLEAVNGRVGVEMAVELMPEMIISDVMMPEMNGIELCNAIKNDVRTSHIPVILLTAKSEQEHRLEGLEAGADDYLPKPFNVKELNLRVQKLIEWRIRLRNRLLEAPTLSFRSLEGSPVENQFIEQITNCIHERMADPQFSVAVLGEHLNLSVSQLNRKLRAITGLTANKYIQNIRLKKALVMLETEDLNVSEVAFKTGFGSTAYFVKSFREEYGKTPGAVLRRE